MAVELTAESRSDFGKEKCKKLRAAGRLPANLYGSGLDAPLSVSLDLHRTEIIVRANGRGADYTLIVDGKSYPARIQEIQREPIYKKFVHLDFVVRQGG